MRIKIGLWTTVLWVFGMASWVSASDTRVVLITLDGVRQQEFFRGADFALESNFLRRSRESLLPFIWKQWIGRQKAWVFGNQDQGQFCKTDNPIQISLPAYADLLSGVRQARVDRNTFDGQMDFPTIFDRLLKNRDLLTNEIAVFTSWKNIARVLTQSGGMPDFFVQAGRQAGEPEPPWWHARYDRDTMSALEQRLQSPGFNPRFLFVSFNDSDEWGHRGDYAKHLESLQDQDRYIRRIYDLVEKKPGYSGHTIYILTTDHGRGEGKNWMNHGHVQGAEYIWAVVHSPRLELKPRPLLLDCSHSAMGQWIYEVLSNREFQKG